MIYEEIIENNSILQIIVFSTVDIIVIVLIVIFRRNCTIYNKTEKKLVKLKKYRLNSNTKGIDLNSLEHKITSNIFIIKVSKFYLKKHRNQQLNIKRKSEKTVSLVDEYYEFILD